MVIPSTTRTALRGGGLGRVFVGSRANDSGVIDGMGCATGTDVSVGDGGGGAAAGVQAAKSRANTSTANQRNVMWKFMLTPLRQHSTPVAPTAQLGLKTAHQRGRGSRQHLNGQDVRNCVEIRYAYPTEEVQNT